MNEIVFNHQAQQEFAALYWASKDPKVAALKDIDPSSPDRRSLAETLAAQGFQIDVPIQVWGWDPYATMAYRAIDGLTWVPSALQPNIGLPVPSINNPPYNPYDPNSPPAGSIKVSINPADYPAFNPPVPEVPKPTESVNLVGDKAFGDTYKPGPGVVIGPLAANVTDGEKVIQDGVTYQAKVSKTPFGITVLFTTKVSQ